MNTHGFIQSLWKVSTLFGGASDDEINHGPSQSGHHSRVHDLLATFTLNFSLIAK